MDSLPGGVARRGVLGEDGAVEATRIDRWLWAVRIFKTRSEATTACRGGKVRINGKPTKPASPVAEGDRVEARLHNYTRIVDVTRVIDTRVGAPIAIECYVDHTPPPPPKDTVVADRDRGAGRPTKRERRQLDRWRTAR